MCKTTTGVIHDKSGSAASCYKRIEDDLKDSSFLINK